MKGNTRMMIPQRDPSTTRSFFRNGVGMSICKKNGEIWIRCSIMFQEGKIDEHLYCVDFDKGIFQLTQRIADAKVSITDVCRRHRMFPLNELVRMKVKNAQPDICTAGC